MNFKKIVSLGLVGALSLSLASCGSKPASNNDAATEDTSSKSDYSVAMITDTGGVNDQSFNQSAWEGLQELRKDTGVAVNYVESKQAADFVTNLDRLADEGATLLWGIGYACADAILEAANANPDLSYAIIDNAYPETPSNVTGVMFRAEEPSFMVGYVAGMTTESNKVGFVGGIQSELLDTFKYGYMAGVSYAAKERGVEIEVMSQWAESFSDAAKGKAIANKMISDGCDVIYHAAGGSGTGAIEACKEAKVWAIGVDRDQAYLAPEYVLTSALKLVGKAVQEVSKNYIDGKAIGGETLTYGLKEECVGIPEEHGNMKEGVYEATLKVGEDIIAGKITPPTTEDTYNSFVQGL